MEINTSLHAVNLGNRLILDGRPFIGGICLHDTAGSGSHNDTLYLQRPGDGRKVSVDFTVERDGAVYQLNPDLVNKCTFHAGRATAWKVGNRSFRNQQVTKVLIGIELVHRANPTQQAPIWPADQIAAVADLCFYLCAKFGLDKTQITTHAKIITDGSRVDPRDFPFSDFWFYFNKRATLPAVGRSEAAGLADPLIYEVVAGDSLWGISKKFNRPIEDIKSLNGISTASNLIRPGQKLIIHK